MTFLNFLTCYDDREVQCNPDKREPDKREIRLSGTKIMKWFHPIEIPPVKRDTFHSYSA